MNQFLKAFFSLVFMILSIAFIYLSSILFDGNVSLYHVTFCESDDMNQRVSV